MSARALVVVKFSGILMFRPLLATLSSASLGRFDLIVCSAKMPASES
jgi:cytochrome b subunit of formate dehydrogenase